MPQLMFTQIVKLCRSAAGWGGRFRGEVGATAVEYSLLIAFVATAIVVIVGTLGRQLPAGFQTVIAGL